MVSDSKIYQSAYIILFDIILYDITLYLVVLRPPA